jgi:hypothetical protein
MYSSRILCALLLAVVTVAASQTPQKSGSASAASKAGDNELLYRNAAFGFRFKIPYGWVDRTKEMHEPDASDKTADDKADSGKPVVKGESSGTEQRSSGNVQGEVLLAVFERPPDAVGDTVNSAVVIASESAASYPGLKKAEDYLAPLTELTTSKGFKAEGEPAFTRIDTRQLVRADFSKSLSGSITMHQTTLVLLAKGQLVSFTFIGSSEDEVDELIDGLHFGAAK